MATPPGWYADPAGRPLERLWDGDAWTDHTRPRPAQAPTPFTAPAPPSTPFRMPGQSAAPWYQRKRFIVPTAIVTTLIVVGAIGAANQPAPKTTTTANNSSTTNSTHSDARPNTGTSAATTVRPATSVAVAAAAKPTAAKPTHPVASPSRTTKPAPTSSEPGVGSFRMPNEVGSVLQDAQDDVQRVSGDPVFFSHSHDLLGGRFQILDRDWKVCSQNVPAGTTVSAVGHIDFGVVKLDETCP